jgi:hypothetical protein
MSNTMFVLALEERLHADADGSFRQETIAHLNALHASLLAQRRQLQRREDYYRIQAALSAVEGAIRALQTVDVMKDGSMDD